MRLFYFLFLLPFYAVSQKVSTGSSLAVTFIQSLDSAQKRKAVFAFEDTSRYKWHFVPAYSVPRDGVAIMDLDSMQKQNIYALLKTCLSSTGYTRSQDIMNTEYLLKELQPNSKGRIPENYLVAFYGNPEKDKRWGWKISGHHLALNYTMVNDQLAFAPFFLGVYPAVRNNAEGKEIKLFKDEEEIGFKLVNALTPEQRLKAVFRLEAFADIVTGNSPQVQPLEAAGILAKDLAAAQKDMLNQLILTYLANMPSRVAQARMKRIQSEDFDEIRFGWAGGLKFGEPHYYRIQGKTFLIELDNTQQEANHVHTVWRDFYGDYGIDLLKEHYKKGDHQH